MIRVLIVDDSPTFRSILRRAMAHEDDIEVIGTASSGRQGLQLIKDQKPDVVTLDLQMPGMDGREVLKKLSEEISPNDRPKMILVSSLNRESARATLEALFDGADDFISKPSEGGDLKGNMDKLRHDLIARIHSLAKFSGVRERSAEVKTPPRPRTSSILASLSGRHRPDVLLIGSSTGGPQALTKILPQICASIHLPILIVQHMPPMFTRSLAESLDRVCKHRVSEAVDGDAVRPNNIYLAPGGFHMVVRKEGTKVILELNEDPMEHHCRPAVDVFFRSALDVYAPRALAMILTGMGSDGAAGLKGLRDAGVTTLAQSEASSVVWGMPGSAVAVDAVDDVHDLEDIPQNVIRLCQ
jgi:two-component system chemotaxis response regulator CheB